LAESAITDPTLQAPEDPPRRRRRSHRKSGKMSHERRKRLKNLGFWLTYGAIGVVIATAIAILAGQSSN
jgi:hypothetical protein